MMDLNITKTPEKCQCEHPDPVYRTCKCSQKPWGGDFKEPYHQRVAFKASYKGDFDAPEPGFVSHWLMERYRNTLPNINARFIDDYIDKFFNAYKRSSFFDILRTLRSDTSPGALNQNLL